MITGLYLVASGSDKTSKALSDLATKLTFTAIATWITSNPNKAVAMVSALMTAPDAVAATAAALGAYLIYSLNAPTQHWMGVCRTGLHAPHL